MNKGGDHGRVIGLEFERGSEKGKVTKIQSRLKGERYIIKEVFAYGGMGIILRAQDSQAFNNEVLIKAIKYQASEFAFDRQRAVFNIYQFRQMFKRERRILCELRARGINPVPHMNDFFFDWNPELATSTFKFGKLEKEELHSILGLKMSIHQEPYMVMERIYGRSLLDRLSNISARAVLIIVRDVLNTLQKMHEPITRDDGTRLQLIYLDLKPDNIIVDDHDRMTLIDFGGCMPIVDGKKRKEQKGALTHGYAAPDLEFILSSKDRVDGRADVYSAGALLWRFFTAKDPIRLADPLNNPFPVLSPDELPRDLYKPLKDIIARALERNVERRFQSAAEFAGALTFVLESNVELP
ncbi:MAG: serine/threonine protein kinase [Myxococcota bacterium]|jgi:serine/threonine protein kinase|nr:serine/threonine protein kinase [Myxococcota bacterium]